MSEAVPVDPSNADQLRAWDGATGDFWVERADRFNDGVARYTDRLLDAAEIAADSTILDIGCGSGQTTREAARRAPGGTALGVDLSSRSLLLAARLAEREQIRNVTFEQADAQVHPFPDNHFDIVISRHGAMFFGDPEAAFGNIARAMRPDGHLALLTWQTMECNEWTMTFRTILAAGRDLPRKPNKPGALLHREEAHEVLTPAGFTDIEVTELHEPMYFGADAEDACQFITCQLDQLLDDLDEESRATAVKNLHANMVEHQTERGVYYDSAALLIQACRR